ncbi:acetyltransferase, GNAT family [Peptoniphilus sp. oral taxon 375 str. F0436]|nr:acetyltransferase, GNAT family [Peptoniphilus sp. oral taxon 375 str. F0436]
MQDLTIRQAQPQDGEKLLAYLKKIGGETDNLSFGQEGLPLYIQEEEAYIQSMADQAGALICLAFNQQDLVASVSLNPLPGRMGHRAEISLSILKDYWGQGLGSLLLEKALAYARDQGLEFIDLDVATDNTRAIRLYEKFAFKKVARLEDYFKIHGNYKDFYRITLDLRLK